MLSDKTFLLKFQVVAGTLTIIYQQAYTSVLEVQLIGQGH